MFVLSGLRFGRPVALLGGMEASNMNGTLVNVDMWTNLGQFIGTAQIVCDPMQAWPVSEYAVCDVYLANGSDVEDGPNGSWR